MNLNVILSKKEPEDKTVLWIDVSETPISAKIIYNGSWTVITHDLEGNPQFKALMDKVSELRERVDNLERFKEKVEYKIKELIEADEALNRKFLDYVTLEYGNSHYGTLEEQKSLRHDVEDLYGETAALESDKLDKTEAANTYTTKAEFEAKNIVTDSKIDNLQNELNDTKADIESNYVKSNTFNIYKEEEEGIHQAIQESIQSTKEELTGAIDKKQDKLKAGYGINIKEDNTIEFSLDLSLYRVVDKLPLPEDAEENKIYFIKNTVNGQSDIYIEYIVVNGKWEKLGEYKIKIDLSGYLTTEEALQTFAKVDGSNAKGLWNITAAQASKTVGKLIFRGYTEGEFNGYNDKVINIPYSLSQLHNDMNFVTRGEGIANPYPLVFIGNTNESYDGSKVVTVYIPSIPDTLPNPEILTWTGYSYGNYDGKERKNIEIPSDTSQLTNNAGFITSDADITGNAGTADALRRNKDNTEKYSLNSSDSGITYGSIPYVASDGSIRLGNTLQLFDNTASVFKVKLKGINKDEVILSFPSKSGTFALLSDIPTNHVTLDTTQTITGEKTFDSIVNVKNGIKFIESDGKSITLSTYVNVDKDLIAIQADDFIGSFHFGDYILDKSTGKLQYDNNIDPTIDINFPTQEGTIALVSQIPTKLPNPHALKFTGALTNSYDGSTEVTINLPTKYPNPKALTFTGYSTESYNGSTAVEVSIPTKLANPKTLSFTGQQTKTYDGSIDVSVELPTKLPNPSSLTFKGAVTGTYDGSKATEITIPSLTGGSAAESGKYVSGVTVSGHAVTVTKGTLPVKATTEADGLMSKEDKAKLDGIANEENKYSLPLAASGTRGGVQIGYTATGSNIPVQLSSEKMYVALTSTAMKATVSDATTSTSGWMSSADKTKLNGVASNAEVNQNAFSNVKVGTTTVAADSKTDTLELKNGTGISISTNTTDDSVTIGHSNSITAGTASGGSGSVAFGGSITIPKITYDAQGHITSATTTSVTLPTNPNTDTKNTAGSTNKAATKLFLVGAESQAANPQTYSNSNAYIGTDNCLYSGGKKVLTNHQSLANYALKTEVTAVQDQLNTLVENNASEVIDSFKEIEAFLKGVTNKQTLTELIKASEDNVKNWVTNQHYSATTGTVTSVGLSVPTGLTVSGSPVTTSGTLKVSLTSGYVIPKQADLDKYVTLNSAQTITAKKTFSVQQAFTQASGTSPFTVTSNAVVTNLNADLLDGKHASEFYTKTEADNKYVKKSGDLMTGALTINPGAGNSWDDGLRLVASTVGYSYVLYGTTNAITGSNTTQWVAGIDVEDQSRFHIFKGNTWAPNDKGLILTDSNMSFYGTSVISDYITAKGFKIPNGTSSQFLKADGSVDSSTYLTSHQSLANYLTPTATESNTWGNTTGIGRGVWASPSGGGLFFRDDNPTLGQLSMGIDGVFYQNKGRYKVLDESTGATQTWVNQQGFLKSVSWNSITSLPNTLVYYDPEDYSIYQSYSGSRDNIHELRLGTIDSSDVLPNTLYFGDEEYCYIREDEDDHLLIRTGSKGVSFEIGDDYTIELPKKSGTIALLSDIPNTSNFVKSTIPYDYEDYTITGYIGKLLNTHYFGIGATHELSGIGSALYMDGSTTGIQGNFIKLVADLSDGNITANRQIQVNSDERLKENIITVNNDDPRLSYAASIELKNFNYKGSHLSTMGYIAQDVQKILPNLVSEDKEGYLSLNYTELLLLKVAALERENKELKERINSLEERLNKLEEIINNII